MAKTDFLAWVEEAEVEGDAGTEHGFCDSEEESTGHQAAPVEGCCLDCGDEAPEEDAEGAPSVGEEVFPAHDCPSVGVPG